MKIADPVTIDERAVPAGAVLLNQPEPKIADLTYVDLTGLAFTKAEGFLQAANHGAAKREFALAKTALEDAVMRFNRGLAIETGNFRVADLEAELGAKLTPATTENEEGR